jgi:hypothetical protein
VFEEQNSPTRTANTTHLTDSLDRIGKGARPECGHDRVDEPSRKASCPASMTATFDAPRERARASMDGLRSTETMSMPAG